MQHALITDTVTRSGLCGSSIELHPPKPNWSSESDSDRNPPRGQLSTSTASLSSAGVSDEMSGTPFSIKVLCCSISVAPHATVLLEPWMGNFYLISQLSVGRHRLNTKTCTTNRAFSSDCSGLRSLQDKYVNPGISA